MVLASSTLRWKPNVLAALVAVAALAAGPVFGATTQPAPGGIKIPLSVRSFSERPVPPMPVWTGVPLARSAVKKADSLRLLGPNGKPVPAQFDVQATWADGSVKWVLVSFVAARPLATGRQAGFARRIGPEWTELSYTLVDDASVEMPAPTEPVRIRPDTNDITVTTGPLQLRFNRHGFRGISQARLDMSGEGEFADAELVSPDIKGSGIVAVDAEGKVYTSGLGRVRQMRVERPGPLHAVAAFHGDLRSADSTEPLLDYAMRIHTFAGSSLVRVVLTIHNPRPAGRAEDGSRWVLGQSGSVHLKSLQYVQPVRLVEGLRRVTLSPEPGKIFDRIPLTGPMSVYQDSSGGEDWFHRTHVDADNDVPLTFRGYKVSYHGRDIRQGLRAAPWVDVADSRWAVALAAPAFWENFPKGLTVDGDGTIRLWLWPERPAGGHEIQGGEQKTHEFWVYFRHRRRGSGQRRAMPLARELMPACLARPMVWASGRAYADANVTDPLVPAAKGRFEKYEAAVAAAVRDTNNLLAQRERADEYGWRNFGDTWAYNEGDRTEGPYTGLHVVSHFNNEYDLGFGMLEQAMRSVDADPRLARAWWKLGAEALWHEADIDIYHTRSDPAPIYSGGTFTHTAHGVEAGRSTHRASPRDEVYGRLQWPWGRGGGTESGHFRNRGILLAWLLTGDRHLLEAANDVRDLVVYKVANDRFAQIDQPNRDTGNNMQILLDAYLLSWDEKYLKLCEKAAAAASFEAVTKRGGQTSGGDTWQYCLYLKSVGRMIEVQAERGRRDKKAIESFLSYSGAIQRRLSGRRRRRGGGSWSPLVCEVMMMAADLTTDPARRKEFIEAAGAAFSGTDYFVREDGTGRFFNSKTTTMLLQGGGRYMRWVLENKPAEKEGPE